MLPAHIIDCLRILDLSPKEAARLLSVDVKTVNRWLLGTVPVPGPVTVALRAWRRLQDLGLPWRPDEQFFGILNEQEVAEQLRLHLQQAVELDQILQRVHARGGPAAPWKVDLEACEASLGDAMYVHFYRTNEGSFSPSTYRRTDREPDYDRDQPLLEDAIACIADAISQERRAPGAR